MKKTILFKAFNLFIVFTLILSGFAWIPSAKAADIVLVTGITLDKPLDTIDVGASTKLTATVEPTTATNKDVIWETDNPAIARVADGIVRGYGEGTAIIKATTKDQGKVAICIITVHKPTAATPIIDIKADDDNNGIPDFIIAAAPFIIEGRVSADFRTLVSNTLSGTIYIQDSKAGIAVNGIANQLTLGAKVRVTGNVIYNNGETQFLESNIETVAVPLETVNPITISTQESMKEKNEGLLVKIQGKITKTSDGTIYVNDATNVENEARIIVGNYFTINASPVTSTTTTTSTTPNTTTTPAALKIGDTVSVTGIASQDDTGHKIVIRNAGDLTVVTIPASGTGTKENAVVRLNKSSIVIKAGKFEHINILTTPGNAVITSVKIKTPSPIVTISQDKNNKRLIKVTPNKTIDKTSQKLEIEVNMNGKTYTLTLDVRIDGAKVKTMGKGK